MVRLKPNGELDSINRIGTFSPDGKRKASITTFFSRKFMKSEKTWVLGYGKVWRGPEKTIFRAELASRFKDFRAT